MLTDVVGPLRCQHLRENIVNPCTQGPTEERMMLRISSMPTGLRKLVRKRLEQ